MNSKQTVSWDDFIANLMDKGYVSSAAICRIKDGKRWSASCGFDVTPEQVAAIAAGFEDGGIKLRNAGIYVGGKRFVFTRADSTVMIGRDCATGTGCVIYRCGMCFVIGTYDDSTCAGGCWSVVTKMGDFLRCSGY